MTCRIEKLSFYATPPHECNYLPEHEATTLFADPQFPKSRALYSALAANGFRRSGEHLYQPYCSACNKCVPVRIPVDTFRMRRTQKRTWLKNRDITIEEQPPEYREEQFMLYRKYIHNRHAGGGMDNPTPGNYMEFLTSSWSDTLFYEMRLNKQLVAVAVVDVMVDALSAVYTFFDTDLQKRSLGNYAILYEIQQAKQSGLKWLYLGYWIDECDKMRYKTEYQPAEFFINGEWQTNEY